MSWKRSWLKLWPCSPSGGLMLCSRWRFESRELGTLQPQVPHGAQSLWFLGFISEGFPYSS